MLVRGRGRRMAAARDCEREFMVEIRSGARLSQVSAASSTWRGKQLLSFWKASLNAKIPHLIFRQSANLSKPARASRISRGTFSTRRVPVIKRAAVLCSRSRRSALIVPRPLQARDAYSRGAFLSTSTYSGWSHSVHICRFFRSSTYSGRPSTDFGRGKSSPTPVLGWAGSSK